MKSIFPKAAVVMAMSQLVACVTQESQVVMQQKEGYAVTHDGVKISYELIGPSDAPVLWVEYPWSGGWRKKQGFPKSLLGSLSSRLEHRYLSS